MKDAYSFDRDEDGHARVVPRSCTRRTSGSSTAAGWIYVIVEADPGPDRRRRQPRVHGVARASARTCSSNARTATTWPTRRPRGRRRRSRRARGPQPLTEIDTPNTPTIESLAALLGVEPSQTLKCVMFDVAGTATAVLVPGDREVNEDKLEQARLPGEGAPVRGRRLRDARVREGLRRPAGVRRGRRRSSPTSRSAAARTG